MVWDDNNQYAVHAYDARFPVAEFFGVFRWDDAEQPVILTVVLPSTECRIDVIYLFEHLAD